MKEYATLLELQAWAARVMERAPDVVIGEPANPYMRRWHVLPRNQLFNIYLHEILRSDDDRAGHDHPWANTSFILQGEYEEYCYGRNNPTHLLHKLRRTPGERVERDATDTHRLVLPEGGRCVSLFVTGPVERAWGFWCPNRWWVPWEEFTAGPDGSLVGKGCD